MKPRIGYGTFLIRDVATLKACIKQAIMYGYDFIDTAHVYYNEAEIGKAFALLREENFNEKIKIQTKIYPTSYDDIYTAVQLACKRLRVSKLDMCLLHRRHFDLNKDISAWKQLIKCQELGMVDEIGVSNYDRDDIEIMKYHTGVYPAFNQIELSVNNWRDDRVHYCKSKGIEVQAWSPMGYLEDNLKNPQLIQMAQKYNVDVPTLLIAYLSSLNVSVVVKSANPNRVAANKKAFGIQLNAADVLALKALNTYRIRYSQTYSYDINLNEEE